MTLSGFIVVLILCEGWNSRQCHEKYPIHHHSVYILKFVSFVMFYLGMYILIKLYSILFITYTVYIYSCMSGYSLYKNSNFKFSFKYSFHILKIRIEIVVYYFLKNIFYIVIFIKYNSLSLICNELKHYANDNNMGKVDTSIS